MDLKSELVARGISQSELARLVGVSSASISQIVNGQSPGKPATHRLIRAALAGYDQADRKQHLAERLSK